MNKKTQELVIPSSINCLQPVKTRFGKEAYRDNPFLEAFCLEVRKKSLTVAAGLSIKDKDDNDVSAGAVAMYQVVDRESFLKIYVKNMKAIFELSKTAQRVLYPLMLAIQKQSKDIAHVYFSIQDANDCCAELQEPPLSQPTYSRGLAELIKRQFIAANSRGQGWFWINPNVLFNGDRIRFVKEYRVRREQERLEQGSLL